MTLATLRPFAEEAERYDDSDIPDDMRLWQWSGDGLTVGDLRRARAEVRRIEQEAERQTKP